MADGTCTGRGTGTGTDTGAERDGEAGTTLVELLVALALLSLIALFIGQGIASLRAMAPVAGRIEAAGDGALVRDHLRQTLGEALAGLPGGRSAPFRGTPAAMAFLAPGDPFLEVGGVVRVELSLEAADAGLDLVERRRVERAGDAGPGSRTVLLRGLREARFAYAPPLAGEAPDWRDAWDESGASPALVRLVLTPGDGPPGGAAALLVHPMAMPASPAGAPPAPPAPPAPSGG